MALDLSKTVVEILKQNPQQYFTARQLAEKVFELKTTECYAKMKRSKATVTPIDTEDALIDQLVSEIAAYTKRIKELSVHIKTTADRPRKYYYTEQSDVQEIETIEEISNPKKVGHPEPITPTIL